VLKDITTIDFVYICFSANKESKDLINSAIDATSVPSLVLTLPKHRSSRQVTKEIKVTGMI
jgi:hypothetical protein